MATTKFRTKRDRLRNIWRLIKYRIDNPKNPAFKNYGGRGISLCDRWRDFELFWDDVADDYQDGLWLDRIDNDGDYCPENCRWATPKEQQRNRSNNKFITINDETKTLAEWSEISPFKRSTILQRIYVYGWTAERALGLKEA